MLSLDNSYSADDLTDFDQESAGRTGLEKIPNTVWNPSLTAAASP